MPQRAVAAAKMAPFVIRFICGKTTGRAGEHPFLIEFSDVGLRYGNGPEILSDLTFSIEPGSFHFLTGPSGSGKTSLGR